MTDYQKKISEIIEQVLTEKTFNLEIVEKIKRLREDVSFLTSEVERLNKEKEDLEKRNEDLSQKLADTEESLNSLKSKEKEILKREKNIEKMQYELEFQKARAEEIRQLFEIVFRNPTVLRTRTIENLVQTPGNSYPTVHTTKEQEKEEIV